MALRFGIKGSIQFVREATYGTAATATHRIGAAEGWFEAKPQLAMSKNMPAAYYAQGSQPWVSPSVEQNGTKVGEWVEGHITVPLDYDGHLQFIDMAMGTASYSTYGATVTGAGPYTHTWGKEREFVNSMTIEVDEGQQNSGQCTRIVGCKVTKLTIMGKAQPGEGGVLEMGIDFIGRLKTFGATTAGSISAISRKWVTWAHLSTWEDGSSESPNLRDFEFVITPSLSQPVLAANGLIREPVRDGLIVPTIKMTREFSSDTLIQQFLAGGPVATPPTISFVSGSLSLSIAFQAAYISSAPQPRPGLKGIMLQEVTYAGLWAGNAGAVNIVAVSTQNGAAA